MRWTLVRTLGFTDVRMATAHGVLHPTVVTQSCKVGMCIGCTEESSNGVTWRVHADGPLCWLQD